MDIGVSMKQLLFIAACCCVFAGCAANRNDESGQTIDGDNYDTCSYAGDDLITGLPPGFIMDTIKKPDSGNNYQETIIAPRLTGASFRELDGVLQKEIIMLTAVGMSSGDEAMVDTDKLQEDTSETNVDILPLTIYKTHNLVSYGFLNIMVSEGMMRPYRRYFAINYDMQKNRFIRFSDYFDVQGKEDTSFLQWVIYSDMGMKDVSVYKLRDGIIFSSDKENVYFYFDQFGDNGTAYGIVKGVKKKYLRQFIKDDYK